MKLSLDEIMSAKIWAQTHAGEDDPLDVFHEKLLAIGKAQLEAWERASKREIDRCEGEMEEIRARFKLAPDPDPYVF